MGFLKNEHARFLKDEYQEYMRDAAKMCCVDTSHRFADATRRDVAKICKKAVQRRDEERKDWRELEEQEMKMIDVRLARLTRGTSYENIGLTTASETTQLKPQDPEVSKP